jgi:3-phenylpropionate/trans-cinnamate dioxygenase ferredoxin reductase component
MTPNTTFVIVGAGLAGAKAAEALRAWRFPGRVVLIGEEPLRPYERPPLSKGYLRGRGSFDDAAVHEPGYYAEHGIELLTATIVTALDTRRRQVTVEPGGVLHYDRLLLATGAQPRPVDIPGRDLDGVLTLRTVADADAIRAAARPGTRALVVGAGWIGGEVTASLRRRGIAVTLVDHGSVPYARTLGPQIGGVYCGLHAENGVVLHPGATVTAFTGDSTVTGARLTDGTTVPCDLAVVGIGVRPCTALAEAAGLATDNGITVNQFLQTSDPYVYAAGDVANAYHPTFSRPVRLEHWWAALNQGPVAAANMLGKDVVYDWMPYFGSRQYDFEMEYTGYAPEWDEIVFRGEPSSRRFAAFWLKDGRVRAGMNAEVWGYARHIRALVSCGQPVDRHRLADPDVALASVVAA